MELLVSELTEKAGSWIKDKNKENVIDDFVFFLSFCGNDFLRQLPFFSILKNALVLMMDTYM